jgi:phytanoyl-CoA hydroxylase
MRSEVTQAHIDRYRADGFVVVEDLVTPDELAELGAAVDRATGLYGDKKIFGNADWKDTGEYYDSVFLQRLNLWRVDATVKRYMLGAEVGRIAAQLAGVDLRVWHDQTLQKPPWGNPTAWHLDVPYWSFKSPHAISIWIALGDSTLENGCMHYLPGSHKLVTYENVGIGNDMGGLFKVYPQLGAIEPVAVPLKAGSCAFHNGLTAHAAGVNMTPRWRKAMTCGFMPVGSTFDGNANILSKERLERLKVGDSLDDDEENPRVSWLYGSAVGAAS